MGGSSATALRATISAERIDEWVAAFAALTEPGTGVTRLAYSPLEREAHELFAERMGSLGLAVSTDAAGNTLAELAPTEDEPERGAVGTGSHLDSVPSGGRFDGTAGVVAAMEVATVVVAERIPHVRPWRFVAFAAEEGARFGQACNGSRMAAGLTLERDLHGLRDAHGVTMHEAMAAVGLRPQELASARWHSEDWASFIELHIEQGQVLEGHGFDVGVVDAISGSTRVEATVSGRASHTGGTPMHLRRDALVTAAACVLACDAIARDPEHHGTRVTVGRLTVEPGSITTIPGRVVFTVDIRDIDSERQRRTADALAARFRQIATERGTGLELALLGDTSPVVLSERLSEQIIRSAEAVGARYRVMPSGASHDTQQINHLAPTGMIFVPSRDGLSHVPEEFTTSEQIAIGTDVLLQAMIRMDAR